ncbi:hypothetical protein [Nocardia vaccinii]|uniref:hypothetical protein n=1 Tax=Nocardia vaccinii TaxID=1822 RepID=UPI00082C5423|nr:hypothetical protein [Nocardia vaccinii]
MADTREDDVFGSYKLPMVGVATPCGADVDRLVAELNQAGWRIPTPAEGRTIAPETTADGPCRRVRRSSLLCHLVLRAAADS